MTRTVTPPSEVTSPFLKTEDVAELLACSVRTVHELTRTRAIPHRRPARVKRCLFLRDEVLAWIDGAALEVIENEDGSRVVRTAGG